MAMRTINWMGVRRDGRPLWTFDGHPEKRMSTVYHEMVHKDWMHTWMTEWAKAMRAGKEHWEP